MSTVTSTRRRSGSRIERRRAAAGWLFVAPVLVVLGLFLLVPVLMAAWVSVSDWTGRGSPLASTTSYVGADNYRALLVGGGLPTQDFGTALRNNAWYVFLVVPVQTALSLGLAVLVNRRLLRARGFFRTAFYFPSVTSSVAITVVFLFLFSASGAVNRLLSAVSADGPNWMSDARGVVHIVLGGLGVDAAPTALAEHGFVGLSWWDWLAGPSVAMCVFIIMAVFTTSGTFMLLFLAALQAISADVDEAAIMDGATGWQRFRSITLPMLRPTIFTVTTLGLIGTWQVFEQIYTGSQGGPAKSTLTPAYLSYSASFLSGQWGRGAAIAFVLFAIIIVLTALQRYVLREKDVPRRKRFLPPPAARSAGAAPGPVPGPVPGLTTTGAPGSATEPDTGGTP